MSNYNLNYFPPNNTKFKWGNKELKHSDWCCDILENLGHKQITGASIYAHVGLNSDNEYYWKVTVFDWCGEKFEFKGKAETAIFACMQAEECGELEFNKLFPDWVKKALSEKWRPPAKSLY